MPHGIGQNHHHNDSVVWQRTKKVSGCAKYYNTAFRVKLGTDSKWYFTHSGLDVEHVHKGVQKCADFNNLVVCIYLGVHGEFFEWTPISPCSVPCGDGVQQWKKTCSKPRHKRSHGEQCADDGIIETRICKMQPCPM